MIKKSNKITPQVTEEELESIIETMEDEGVIENDNAELMQNALNINDTTVYEIMTPRVDVKEEDNSYVLEMELPGCCEKDVNIELEHGNLTISSKIEEVEDKEEKKHKAKWILKERRTSSFTRRFTLPSDVDGENITANFKNGILTVMMQKKAIPAPKKISIEAL